MFPSQSSQNYPGMRILHTESAVGLGGQELRVLQEVVGMRKRGHQVYLSVPPKSQLANYAQEEGIPLIPINMALWRWGLMVYQYMKIYVKYDIDIVNTHGSIDSWTASIAGRLSKRAPVIIRSRHKSTPVSPSLRHRWLYAKLPHLVIATGEIVRQGLIRNCGVKPSQIVSIPTGVDLSKFYPREPDNQLKEALGIPQNFIIVGTIGFLRGDKGIDDYLRAAALVSSNYPEAMFLVIGDGPERTTLEALARELGIEKRVNFLGMRDDIPQLLSIIDVVVLCSVSIEGISQVLTQALAMERPVVATSVGGTPEIIKDNETGLLVSPRDPQQICLAIIKILGNQPLGRKWGKAGLCLVCENYTHEKMLDRTLDVYKQVFRNV